FSYERPTQNKNISSSPPTLTMRNSEMPGLSRSDRRPNGPPAMPQGYKPGVVQYTRPAEWSIAYCELTNPGGWAINHSRVYGHYLRMRELGWNVDGQLEGLRQQYHQMLDMYFPDLKKPKSKL
ncbi:hypothetical protein KEM56_006154, partial [Ascosphaera pollenicola]